MGLSASGNRRVSRIMTSSLSTPPILQIENLSVAYQQETAWLEAVRDFSLQIEPGQSYGLVGESGSGKTTIAMAIMRYLGEEGRVFQGRIALDGRDLLALSESEMRRVWGAQMSLVPQNPLSSLNPSIRIGEQLAEVLRFHEGLDRAAADARIIKLLRMVRLPEPEVVANNYPHQISGGMQQRVLIAMALSTAPRLLVLDEPTTSLDVTTQASILDLFRDLIHGIQSAVLYVTHNLGVVAQICDRVAVLYAGELVEDAPLEDLFRQPLHPYTRGLLDSVPKLGQNKSQVQLQSIQGQIPPIGARPSGCVFIDRCPLAIEACRERPPLYTPDSRRSTRCHRWEEIAAGKISARQPSLFPAPHSNGRKETSTAEAQPPVLSLEDLKVYFDVRRSLAQALAGRPVRQVKAVDGIDLSLPAGKTIGMVGESGSGKTTLARAVVGLVERTGGEIELLGVPLPPTLSRRGLETLKHLQMVFQNPEEALNPYLSVGASLRRPLMTLMGNSRQEADAEVQKLLAAVRLPGDYARRMPGQLSGGEKQRVAIARAFASSPDLLLADEPVSSLDVSVQASILNLLNQLQAEQSTTMLFISHDLAVVGYLADEIAVIYLGHLMEFTRAKNLFEPPYHPYTEALLSAIPLPDPRVRRENIRLEGDIPSPAAGLTGCPFHTRCPRFLGDICVQTVPPWRVDERTGKRYFCHIPPEDLLALEAKATGAQ
jgi:peptide/nickel transport system ATP-binding protein